VEVDVMGVELCRVLVGRVELEGWKLREAKRPTLKRIVLSRALRYCKDTVNS
jgi:hypothetical protein